MKILDNDLKILIEGIEEKEPNANILIVSDHGMAEISPQRIIFLEDILGSYGYNILHNESPLALVYPKKNSETKELFEAIKTYLKTNGHFKAWLKENLPLDFHYKNSDRISPIILLADDGYTFALRKTFTTLTNKGSHGYDYKNDNMAGIFMMKSPKLNPKTIKKFKNIEIYNIICKLLGIRPLPNNGTEEFINKVLDNF